MLMPKRTKHRKTFRLPYEGKAKGNTELHFGSYGLMAKEGAWITSNQIEAARVAMTRYMKRGGKVWVNIFPNLSLRFIIITTLFLHKFTFDWKLMRC